MLTTRYHLDEAHLKYYDEKLKSWALSQPVKTIPSTLYPWTLTDKAGAVSCWPVGGTELKPAVDFLFTETGPASGDKGPENPSTITGVSEVNLWLAGKNINRTTPYYSFVDGERVINGVTFKTNQDGSVTVNGTATANANCDLFNANSVANNGTSIGVGVWKVSGCPSGGLAGGYALQTVIRSGYGTQNGYDWGSGNTVTITKPEAKIGLIIRITSGSNIQNVVFKPQIELGSEITEYEQPVEKQNFTLPLGNTYYGGSVDLSTGVLTVTYEGFAYTGMENIKKDSTYGFYYDTTQHLKIKTSTSFTTTRFNSSGSNSMVSFSSASNSNFGWSTATSATWATVDDLKSWLASLYASNVPLVISYELAVPYTVSLTPQQIYSLSQPDKYTPRLNTIYTDAQAVQVGYVKSPIREEFELQQAIVAQGGNI